jgi:cytochrome c-type biogenesis protein
MGMSVMMLGVTALSGLGREAMVRRISGVSGRLTRVAGIVLILAGVAQIYLFLFRYDGLQTLGLA